MNWSVWFHAAATAARSFAGIVFIIAMLFTMILFVPFILAGGMLAWIGIGGIGFFALVALVSLSVIGMIMEGRMSRGSNLILLIFCIVLLIVVSTIARIAGVKVEEIWNFFSIVFEIIWMKIS